MSTIRLLPCPFCGGEPTIRPWHGGRPTKKLILCSNGDYYDEDGGCSAGPSVCGETEEEAAAAWNRRTDSERKLTPEEAWTILCETPDITSPTEYPDHALISLEQLRSYMERAAPVTTGGGEQWWPISAAPKDGTELIGRCDSKSPAFSFFWEGHQFVHYSHGEGYIAYPVKEWMPMPGSSELDRLANHLKSLISENPETARLAASREDLRMWFVAELTSVASARTPLVEIEAMVSRHLTPAIVGGVRP